MASAEVLDFERLMKPISEELPAGDAFRTIDPTGYFEIKRLRDAARKSEKQFFGDTSESSGEGDEWDQIHDMCIETIAEKSKDLQIAAWLIEALIRRHGFAGLRDGFRLVRELSDNFWDGIHPRPDEDGVLTTVAPLAGLNGEEADGPLIPAIGRVFVTNGTSEGPFELWQFRQAHDLEQVEPDKREQRLAEGWVSLSMFDRAVAETPADFFQNLLEDLTQSQEEFASLEKVLDEKCGKDDGGFPLTPPTSRIREALEDAKRTIEGFSRDVLGAAAEEDDAEAAAVEAGDGAAAMTVKPNQRGVRTREDAFKLLLEVADFFKKTEPHSPVSYAIQQAVRWGRMTLPELLKDLIDDSSSRERLYRQVGIVQPSDED